MKGILLAGGNGTRLKPLTNLISKQLLPIYDKPLIFYPLSVLMMAGVREIAIVIKADQKSFFESLLGQGSDFGISITYFVQEKPEGIAQAFLICREFIKNQPAMLVLGDNIFYGPGFGVSLEQMETVKGAQIFAIRVDDPSQYGVVEIDSDGKIIEIVEKPLESKSKLAIPGMYFFDSSVTSRAEKLTKSERGEFEITSLIETYQKDNSLKLNILPRGTTWFDCGTVNSMCDASSYVRVIEEKQGLKIGCIEEIAWRNGWITKEKLKEIVKKYRESEYGNYLMKIIEE